MNVFEELEAVSVAFHKRGFETFTEKMALSCTTAVVGKGGSPGDPLHDFGNGVLIVVRGSNAKMKMGVHESICVEFEGVLLFVVGYNVSE